jgi:pyruvate/2-oxoglutarate dehydrogenase complex dihydrolipoamide dehydrogenase (E3) component
MYDVIVAGGTLGVFVAVSLAQKGLRVAVVERGKLAGRTQEWNISRKELLELVEVSTQGEGGSTSVREGGEGRGCYRM